MALALLLVCCPCTHPQAAPNGPPPVVPTAEEKRKALEADVERLVQMARELKLEVEHTRQDELSIKVLRDADNIEKLARSTRGRLR